MGKKVHKKRTMIISIIVLACVILLVIALIILVEMRKAESLETGCDCETIYSFYAEPDNSLDGIYLGTSAANRYWVPARAFEKDGICIYNFGTTNQPFVMTKYLIKEALKTQPDMDVIVIEIRGSVRPVESIKERYIKSVTDVMPYSSNRNEMIKATLDYFAKVGGTHIDPGRADYYFPIVREKGAWLLDYDFDNIALLEHKKSDLMNKGFKKLFYVTPVDGPVEYTDAEPLESPYAELVEDLLKYCKTIEPKVVFVASPYQSNYGWEGEAKYVLNRCEEEGFDTLDFNCKPLQSQFVVDWSKDFYDFKHVNTYGAVKYTDFLSSYLAEEYEIEDHRGEAGYEIWHDAIRQFHVELEAGGN